MTLNSVWVSKNATWSHGSSNCVSSQDTEREVSSFLSKKLSGRLAGIDMVERENLDLVSRQSWMM